VPSGLMADAAREVFRPEHDLPHESMLFVYNKVIVAVAICCSLLRSEHDLPHESVLVVCDTAIAAVAGGCGLLRSIRPGPERRCCVRLWPAVRARRCPTLYVNGRIPELSNRWSNRWSDRYSTIYIQLSNRWSNRVFGHLQSCQIDSQFESGHIQRSNRAAAVISKGSPYKKNGQTRA
jgi:hypothetical protein